MNSSHHKDSHAQNRKILIRSKREPTEDQVDLCPRIWSREFAQRSPEDRSSSLHLWSNKAWRLCFFCSCLPLCYPCYVSRSVRRRKRQQTKTAPPPGNSVSPQDECNLFDTSGDTMGKTMFHRVSQRKKDSDESIGVNVVLLRSESSPKLEVYLANKREETEDVVDSQINNFIKITRNISESNRRQNSRKSNGNPPVGPQGSSSESKSACSPGDGKSWKTFIQLQKWKTSFRRGNSSSSSQRASKVPSLNLDHRTLEDDANLESMKSSLTEFFDAKSVISTEDEIYINSGASTYRNSNPIVNNSKKTPLLNCDSLKVCPTKISQKVRHHVKPLGRRTVECEGIGYKLQVSIFDEGTITNWSGSDLDQLGSCNIDVALVIVSSHTEVENLMNLNRGLLHYLGDHWRGFYPLLMVHLLPDESEEQQQQEDDSLSSSWCLTTLFGDVYQLSLRENELFESIGWLTDVMGRLYLHSRLYQCSKFYGKGIHDLPECPGGCQLSKVNNHKRTLPFTRKKVKWKMRSLVKFSKLASEEASRPPPPPANSQAVNKKL